MSLNDLPLTKLEELRSAHVWEMQRREISDNFYLTSGRFADDDAKRRAYDNAILALTQTNKAQP